MAIPSHTVRRGARTFVLGMAAYALAVVAATLAVNAIDPALPVRVALALLPATAFLWAMSGWLRAVRGFDELGRRIHVEAATTTLAVLVAGTATYGLLQAYAGLPAPHAFVVFSAAWAIYALAGYVAQRRYR